jgi:hypothetical protein
LASAANILILESDPNLLWGIASMAAIVAVANVLALRFFFPN